MENEEERVKVLIVKDFNARVGKGRGRVRGYGGRREKKRLRDGKINREGRKMCGGFRLVDIEWKFGG